MGVYILVQNIAKHSHAIDHIVKWTLPSLNYFFRRPNIFDRLLPLLSSLGGPVMTGSGGGSEVRRNAARSDVRDTLDTASRGSNFFIGTRPEDDDEAGCEGREEPESIGPYLS